MKANWETIETRDIFKEVSALNDIGLNDRDAFSLIRIISKINYSNKEACKKAIDLVFEIDNRTDNIIYSRRN